MVGYSGYVPGSNIQHNRWFSEHDYGSRVTLEHRARKSLLKHPQVQFNHSKANKQIITYYLLTKIASTRKTDNNTFF